MVGSMILVSHIFVVVSQKDCDDIFGNAAVFKLIYCRIELAIYIVSLLSFILGTKS